MRGMSGCLSNTGANSTGRYFGEYVGGFVDGYEVNGQKSKPSWPPLSSAAASADILCFLRCRHCGSPSR